MAAYGPLKPEMPAARERSQGSFAKSDKWEEQARDCAAEICRAFQWDDGARPALAVVLGSGFDPVALGFEIERGVDTAHLPGFPAAAVPGHAGRLLLARLAGVRFLVCHGRAHYYEGHAMDAVMFPTRVLAQLGVKELLLTNAAGGIKRTYHPGDFMLIRDHINFTGVNPLRGLAVQDGSCFVDLGEAYSRRLRRELRLAGRRARTKLSEGVYLGVSGPSYETPAEIRAFRKLGADAVGMSTIPEVLMARYCGMEVAAISCITNAAAGMRGSKLSHAEVLESGRASAGKAAALLAEFARGRARKAGVVDYALQPSRKPSGRRK
jgi:purine-nucleoside phosphorylase